MAGSGIDPWKWDGSGRDGGDECDCGDCLGGYASDASPGRSAWWAAQDRWYAREDQRIAALWPDDLLMAQVVAAQ